jgi:hypothetical protein
VDTLPKALGTRLEGATHPDALEREEALSVQTTRPRRPRRAISDLRWPLGVYAATRLVLAVIAYVDTLLQHWTLSAEIANWDGVWYLSLLAHGYPTHVSHAQTTLGFFPLYPLTMWLVTHALLCSPSLAGLLISVIGGFVATVLVQRLCSDWWGQAAGRRAVLLFCLFPGSIVFSMIYTEGLLIPLVAACLLALERRRWLVAGLLAAAATATGPVAVALIPACAVAAALELRRRRWRDLRALRALAAPLLAPLGIVAFGAFLWLWTGSPLASYAAQRYGWDERSDPLAIVHSTELLVRQIAQFHDIHHPAVNLNYLSGLIGAVVLIIGVWLLLRERPRIPLPAIVWTIGIGVLTLTSANVPPNPRMLICAFPAVLVFAHRLKDKAFTRLVGATAILFVVMSYVSFVGHGLRP